MAREFEDFIEDFKSLDSVEKSLRELLIDGPGVNFIYKLPANKKYTDIISREFRIARAWQLDRVLKWAKIPLDITEGLNRDEIDDNVTDFKKNLEQGFKSGE